MLNIKPVSIMARLAYFVICAQILALFWVEATSADVVPLIRDGVKNSDFSGVVKLTRSFGGQPPLTRDCNGILISSTWVLTAASCLAGVDAITIKGVGIVGHHIPGVSNKILHPYYDQYSNAYDIAVFKVQLNDPLPGTRILPVISISTNSYAGEATNTIGNGYTKPGNKTLAAKAVLVLSRDECKKILNRYIYSYEICTESVLCQDDTGAGLIFNNKGLSIAIGVGQYQTISECNDQRLASVYTRVNYFAKWIKSVTGVDYIA